MAFHNVFFPETPGATLNSVQVWNTEIITTPSGKEQRFGLASVPRWKISFPLDGLTVSEKNRLIGFYNARRGSLHSFKFKNLADYTLSAETQINPYPTTTMQIKKAYGDSGNEFYRTIGLITPATLVVKDNGVTLTETTDYSCNYTTGIITFAGIYPVSGHTYTVTCEYATKMRFTLEEVSFDLPNTVNFDIPTISMIEEI